MVDKAVELTLKINHTYEADDKEFDHITRRLRKEILELDVEDVDFVKSGESPRGARSGDAVTLGSLLITLISSSGVLPSLVNTIQSWLKRNQGHSITIEVNGDKLEVTGISSQTQQQLIDRWLKYQKAKMKTSD
jgi:hypothetical protein